MVNLSMRTDRSNWLLTTLLTMGGFFTVAGAARASLFETEHFRLYGDFRGRLEADWDSQRADGSERRDRTRLRVRVRLGLEYQVSEHLSFGVRLRTGSDDNQQGPHITVIDFDDNPTGDADFNFDRWYLKAKGKRAWTWIGRETFPFWKQDELFWDDDVTIAGLAAGTTAEVREKDEFRATAGYFSLPAGMRNFSGQMGAGQLAYFQEMENAGFTLAAGYYAIDADPMNPSAQLLIQGNGQRDYSLWVGQLQLRLQAAGKPLVFGGDYFHNSKDYSPEDPDPVTAANFDQTDGWVFMARYGRSANKGQWLAAYYYARIETLSVHSSYAQDDWVRWGSPTQTRGSNLKGHELRFQYALTDTANIVARLYLVESITTVEDGNRFRLDFNFRF